MPAFMLVLAGTTAMAGPHAEASLITVNGILPPALEVVAGSAQIIDKAAIAQMQPITLRDVLRRAPGLQLIDEDALGLKLNISVRGLNARRSGRTLLLEDGAPIQPAPYADPSAHHYPSLDRLAAIEFRKGSGQILFGPQSIGGMINFVSEPVPSDMLLSGSAAGGGRGFGKLQVATGFGDEKGGLRIDLVGIDSLGIRKGHGTRLGEIAVKGRVALGSSHSVTAKFVYSAERSRLTESGLTEARYAADPYANPFADDRFVLNRFSSQLVDAWQLSPAALLTTQIYYADTFRASYRQTDTSVDTMVANPATGCVGVLRADYEAGARFCGNKMRPRRFRFIGIEQRFDLGYDFGSGRGALQFGARLHLETMRRRRFDGLTSTARETSSGSRLRDDNVIETDAIAIHAQNVLQFGRLAVSTGFRFEDIRTRNRAAVANFVAVDAALSSRQRILLPGAGLTWGNRALTLFAGVHRGFAPPRPDRDVDPLRIASEVRPERSTEIEVGVRGSQNDVFAYEATVFNMQLTDLIVDGPLAGGRSGSFVNAGSARHRGIEISGRAVAGETYAALAYTWLADARFTSDAGQGVRGILANRIPYTPEHSIDIAAGTATTSGFAGEIGINYVGRQFANADNRTATSADGQSGLIPARTLARLSLQYALPGSRWRLFTTIENAFDRRYVSSRIDGLFAGQRRQWIVGLRLTE